MADDRTRNRRTVMVWEVEGDEVDAEERIRGAAKLIAMKLKAGKLKLPMLPAAATEALRLAQDPTASMRELERVVEGDPPVAMRVLGVANSAAYGSHNIRTLGQALSRLGTSTIRDILYQAVAESHIFQGPSAALLASEREHAVATAHVARIVCKFLGIDGEYAFLCGLLHDIGRVVLFNLLLNQCEDLSEDEISQLLTRMHAAVGSHLTTTWNLPKLVPEACRRHHTYRASDTMAYSQIGNVIAVADRITMHYGFGRDARPIPAMGEAAFYELGLDPVRIPELIEMAAPAVDAMQVASAPRTNEQSGLHPRPSQSSTQLRAARSETDAGAEESGTFPKAGQSGFFARAAQTGFFRRKAS